MADTKNVLFTEDLLLAEQAAEEAAAVEDLMPGFDRVHFKKDDTIFHEKDNGDAAYLIIRGQVEVRKGLHSSNPQTLGSLGRGDIFGELALFDNSPRMAEAIARSGVEAIRISRDEFLKRLGTTDPVMKAIVLYMVKRVRSMSVDVVGRRDPNWGNWSAKD